MLSRELSTNRRSWLAVHVVGHGMKHLMNAAFVVLLPQIKVSLSLSNAGVGAIYTFRNVSSGVANVPAGFISDRLPYRSALILGLSIMLVGVFTAAVGLTERLYMIILASIGAGIATAFWHPAAISGISRHFAHRRGFVIALHGTGGSVGEALGPLLVGGILLLMGWRLAFFTVGAPGILAGFGIWLLLRNSMTAVGSETSIAAYLESLRTLVNNRSLFIVLIVITGYSATQAIIFTFLPIYIQIDLGYSASVMTLFIAASQVAGIFSTPVMGFLSDRYGRGQVVVPGLFALGVATLGIAVVPAGAPLFFTVILMGAFHFPLTAILIASAADTSGAKVQATVVSLVFVISLVVAGAAPYLGGLLADAYNVKAVFLASAGLAIGSGLFWATLQRGPAER